MSFFEIFFVAAQNNVKGALQIISSKAWVQQMKKTNFPNLVVSSKYIVLGNIIIEVTKLDKNNKYIYVPYI